LEPVPGGGGIRVEIQPPSPPLPSGESLDAALKQFVEEIRKRNYQLAEELVERLQQELRGR
jgi:hypothetical protein